MLNDMTIAGSMTFTIVTIFVAWFKNNYVTDKGRLQKEVLQNRLTK
ncbi:hypothetical protein GPS65_18735 [Bacillus pumilus]|nr:SPP1 phage holin family protein [Bacillus pumilus]QHQ78043.1 hypothetical protein GPS65_18735 [Bacillus pumilus]